VEDSGSPPDRDARSDEEIGVPESVELLLAFLRDVAFTDESERQKNLDSKAGTLAGFVAVALSLEAGLGASVLLKHNIACAPRALFVFFFVVAVLGLVASGLFALLGVLTPKDYLVLDDEQIIGLSSGAEMAKPSGLVRENQLATMADIIVHARKTDNKKAKSLQLAAISLAVAVAAIGAQGLTLSFG
jgi:hypothetical protein